MPADTCGCTVSPVLSSLYPEHNAKYPLPQQEASLYVGKDTAAVVDDVVEAAVLDVVDVVAAAVLVVVDVLAAAVVVVVDVAAAAVLDVVVAAEVVPLADTCSQHTSNVCQTPVKHLLSPDAETAKSQQE